MGKKYIFSEKVTVYIGIGISVLLGALFFLLYFSEIVNPTNISWIMSLGWDPFQHYVGWEFFRRAPWLFPFGMNPHYGFPVGITISYTDSIPLIAFLFKLFSRFLPETFQYLGIWGLVSFALQGGFGFLLAKRVVKRTSLAVIGSILFLLVPSLLVRVGGHTALSAHWLILWALWITLRPHTQLQWKGWGSINALSVLIHPYFLFMNGWIMLADVAQSIWVKKKHTIFQGAVFVLAQICLVVCVGWVIGLFYTANGGTSTYGVYSMNLNALVNPQGWSVFLPDLSWNEGQYEGFQYIGVGGILLLLVSSITMVLSGAWRNYLKRWWPLAVACIILTMLAITHRITLNTLTITTLSLPEVIRGQVLGVIRGSGRLFWPVYYLVLLISLYVISTYKKTIVSLSVITGAVLLQWYDMHAALAVLDTKYEYAAWQTPLQNEVWQSVSREYSAVAFLPDFKHAHYEPVTLFAAQQDMRVNVGYFARPVIGDGAHVEEQITALKAGKLDKNTVYILTEDEDTYKKYIDTTVHEIVTVDGYTMVLPFSKNQ